MQNQDRPIAFFDSGLGGISVLRETVLLLPQENYLYYGDSLHAPYGVKSEAQIQALSLAAAEHLVSAGAKAIVVACNTATSAAIGELRDLARGIHPPVLDVGLGPALADLAATSAASVRRSVLIGPPSDTRPFHGRDGFQAQRFCSR